MLTELEIAEIYVDPGFNCRAGISKLSLVELAKDIKANGLDSPIIVQPYQHDTYKYRLLAGHRRLGAVKMNGSNSIKAIIRQDISDEDAAKSLNLRENLMRTNLTLLEEAKALNYFFQKGYNDTYISKLLNKSAGWVNIRRISLDLPEVVQEAIAKEIVNQSHIKSFHELKSDPAKLEKALNLLKDKVEKGQKIIEVEKEKKIIDLVKVKRPEKRDLDNLVKWYKELNNPNGEFVELIVSWFLGEISEYQFWVSLKKITPGFVVPVWLKNLLGENDV